MGPWWVQPALPLLVLLCTGKQIAKNPSWLEKMDFTTILIANCVCFLFFANRFCL